MNGLAQIRASYPPEKAWNEMSGDLPVYLVYRPLSFLVTAPLLRARVSASAVTAVGALIAIALPFVAARGGAHDYLWVAALAFVFLVLDCVDGNLARIAALSSPQSQEISRAKLGALFDAGADAVFWCALLASFGVLVQKRSGFLAPYGVAIGAFAGMLTLLGRRVRDEFKTLYETRAEMSATRPASLGFRQWMMIVFAGLEHLYPLLVAVAGAACVLDAALVFVFGYALVICVGSFVLAFTKAARLDRERRAPR